MCLEEEADGSSKVVDSLGLGRTELGPGIVW